ncbi:MAG: glycoside hydrolase family 3 C-terminal domain-containing protein, partial [Balneolaceae bacterium]
TPVQLSTQKLHEIHRPAFQAAIDAGVKTVMLNSGEINGVPVHASREIVTDLLRNEMGFEGVVVTDWDDIGKLVDFHKTAKNYKEATYQAVNAGIDINMTPLTLDFNHTLIELAEEGRITMDRIDESVRRILKLKFELGLFENPFPRNDRFDRIGSLENKQKALDAARESIVLLKNEGNHLPLQNPKKIILSGPTADNKRNLSGGWTLAWQGAEEERYPEDMHTIFSALKIEFPEAEIELMNGSDINTGKNSQAFSNRLNDADLIIYAGGEEPYTEFVGNITDLSLPMEQQSEINLLSKSNTPLLLILVQGRPRIITDVFQNVEGLLFAGLPGFEGAEAIANVISGKVNPSGKLPISYPQYPNHFVTYNHKSSDIYFFNPEEANDISQGSDNTSLFEFGYGLSYTDFEYRDLTLSTDRISDKETLRVSVKVINTGVREGKESVLWFITNHVGRITRPVKELKHFEKICLKPGEEKTLYFEIEPIKNLSYPDFDGSAILESGTYTIRVGNISREFNLIKSE